MKDYTKYDFNAIVGAEVEMKTRDGKGTLWTVKGKVRLQDNGLVWVERSEGKPWNDCIIIREIVPGSLTAKIKVEDMSLKQLKRVLDEDVYNSVVFSRDENVIYEQMEIASELSGDYIERKFHDCIDCTDWGWEHE